MARVFRRVDTIVVGAGPAGATAAMCLARAGFQVALLDRASFPRDKACGEFVNPAACALFADAFGPDLLDEIPSRPVHSARLQLPKGQGVDMPLVDGKGCPTSGLSIRRTDLDAALVSRCKAAGVAVLERHNVRGSEDRGESILVFGASDGGTFEIEGKVVLAADGSHSVLARQTGLVQPKKRLRTLGLVAHFRGVDAKEDPGVWLFPSNGDRLIFGLSLQAGDTAVLSGTMPKSYARPVAQDPKSFMREWVSGRPELRRFLEGSEMEIVRMTECFGHKLRRPFADRTLFLGDAARFADPFTGEGIHHAAETGILAAQIATKALRMNDHLLLAEYESAWRALEGRYRLSEAIREVCLHAGVIQYVGERLHRRPEMGRVLAAAITDMAPPETVASIGFLLRLMGWMPPTATTRNLSQGQATDEISPPPANLGRPLPRFADSPTPPTEGAVLVLGGPIGSSGGSEYPALHFLQRKGSAQFGANTRAGGTSQAPTPSPGSPRQAGMELPAPLRSPTSPTLGGGDVSDEGAGARDLIRDFGPPATEADSVVASAPGKPRTVLRHPQPTPEAHT